MAKKMLPVSPSILLLMLVSLLAATITTTAPPLPLPLPLTLTLPFLAVEAKEIVATSEWTELGPNDTVPAGLHIRVDLSTGRKWAKVLDGGGGSGSGSDDREDRDGSMEASSVDVPVESVEVDADGTATSIDVGARSSGGRGSKERRDVAVVTTMATATETSGGLHLSSEEVKNENDDNDDGGGGDDDDDDDDDDHDDGYDYVMMHKALSNLPPEELSKHGGLPALPAGDGRSSLSNTNISPEQRSLFEERMKRIWTERQALLKEVQEKFVADVPKLIMQRIGVLEDYVRDPVGKREEILSPASVYKNEVGGGGNDDDDNDDETRLIDNVLEALDDLDYQLSDLDAARDFHTLGGWALTASLLSDSTHCPPPASAAAAAAAAAASADTNRTYSDIISESGVASASSARIRCIDDLVNPPPPSLSPFPSDHRSLVDDIQSRAARALGTAVKNHEEFHPWALEDLSPFLLVPPPSSNDDDDTAPVTVVSLLTTTFFDCRLGGGKGGGNGNDETYDPAVLDSSLSSSSTPMRILRRKRGLYALGALLRGNGSAREHFVSDLDGPEMLATCLLDSLDGGHDDGDGDVDDGNASRKKYLVDLTFASRILSLAHDLLTDVGTHPSSSSSSSLVEESSAVSRGSGAKADMAMEESFASPPWCDAAIRLFVGGGRRKKKGEEEDKPERAVIAPSPPPVHIREKALEAIVVLSRRGCTYGPEDRTAVAGVRAEWLAGSGSGGGDDNDDGENEEYLDPSYRNDLVALADAALGAMSVGGAD